MRSPADPIDELAAELASEFPEVEVPLTDPTDRFCVELASKFPDLKEVLEEHLRDFDIILPNLFISGVARYAVALFLQSTNASDPERFRARGKLRALLALLEERYSSGHERVSDLIAVSFLAGLPIRGEEEGWQIRLLVGPNMAEQLRVIG